MKKYWKERYHQFLKEEKSFYDNKWSLYEVISNIIGIATVAILLTVCKSLGW